MSEAGHTAEVARLEREILAAARIWYHSSANSEAPLAAAVQELEQLERQYARSQEPEVDGDSAPCP
jgi:hypothetical protein